jgi:5-formyltetrahydrofolate cyclo-ligase
MSKVSIRNMVKSYRNGLSNDRWNEISDGISTQFLRWFAEADYKKVHCYIASNGQREIETNGIIQQLWADEIQVAVPKVTDISGLMRSVLYSKNVEVVENQWGIPEPIDVDFIDEHWPDICIVPMLAGDRHGKRIGYGKGFYDRFLADKSFLKVGLCPHDCILGEIPFNSFDITLDYIITEYKIQRIK